MSTDYKPTGFQAITPFICVENFQEFYQFVQKGLGAEVLEDRVDENGEVFYATIKFDDSIIRIQKAWDAESATPAMLYCYVPNIKETREKALNAGAMPFDSGNNPFNDNDAVVVDKWNNFWWLATKKQITIQ